MRVINKKAYFEYSILEKFLAGVQLAGSEVKAIKDARVSIAEAFCSIHEGEVYIHQMHVSEAKQIVMLMHDPIRERKLLLNKKEIQKLEKETKEKGLTIVPLAVLVSASGFVKIEIGIARGKKLYNKKESIKEKDIMKAEKKSLK
jgi:SsrA-binding protein